MRRLGVTLDDDVDQILCRAAPRGEQAAFIRRAIIETAVRDSLRGEFHSELEKVHEGMAEHTQSVQRRLARIEQLLGIHDEGE